MSAVQRIWGIYARPREAMEHISRKPDWILPLAVILGLSIVWFLVTYPSIVGPEQTRQALKRLETQNIPPERMEEVREQVSTWTSGPLGLVMGLGGVVVGTPVFMLLWALVLYGLSSMLQGQGKFKVTFSVLCYSALVTVPALIVKTPLMFARQTAQVQTSLALILPPDAEDTFLFRLLANFDIFMIWQLIILTIGLAVAHRISRGKSAGIVFGLWLAWVLVATSMAGLLQMGPRVG